MGVAKPENAVGVCLRICFAALSQAPRREYDERFRTLLLRLR